MKKTSRSENNINYKNNENDNQFELLSKQVLDQVYSTVQSIVKTTTKIPIPNLWNVTRRTRSINKISIPLPPVLNSPVKTSSKPKKQRTQIEIPPNSHYILPINASPTRPKEIRDCYCFLIHCFSHKKICVSKAPSSPFIWIPFIEQSSTKCSWTKVAKEGIISILVDGSKNLSLLLKKSPPFDRLQLIEIIRIQSPQTKKLILRNVFYVRLNVTNLEDQYFCCTNTERLEWLDLDYLQTGLCENIWGPELVIFAHKIKSESTSYLTQEIFEFGLKQLFHFTQTNDSYKNMEEIKKYSKIIENDIERFYADFMEHCYPSIYMTFYSFQQYMISNGISPGDFDFKRLFNAFNYTGNGYLNFHEVLLGLVAMEQDTQHEDIRTRFVFRYYDSKKQKLLYEDDLKRMIQDIHCNKDKDKDKLSPITENELNQIVEEVISSIFNQAKLVQGRRAIGLKKFLQIVGKQQKFFRGISDLCRSKKSIFVSITKRKTIQNIVSEGHKSNRTSWLNQVVSKKYCQKTCQSCLAKKYKLAPFIMTINQEGFYEKTEIIQLPTNNKPHDGQHYCLDNEKSSENLLKKNPFLQSDHPGIYFINRIREFNQRKNQESIGFMSNEPEKLLTMFELLFEELEPLLLSENRIKTVNSPCFVIGDIHGNLDDLMSMEATIWKQFPCTSLHYLFLGDYVDRGHWSMECILYLFSMKVLMPSMVTLLRGNHEVRAINSKYTYYQELRDKYKEHGKRLWDITNNLFDCLPICAIIDGTIFCSHGGIPYDITKLSELEKHIPQIIEDPEHDHPVVWQIMWSDPIHWNHFNYLTSFFNETILGEGYVHNRKRGTAYYFNEKALENFLNENRLTHLIRAHEVPKIGFDFHFNRKCITIFSCSRYCGNENECAVLFVTKGKLRIIRINTTQ